MDPISIFIVKNDSKGDRLVFRYPYLTDTQDDNTNKGNNRYNPYALCISEDTSTVIEEGTFRHEEFLQISDKDLSSLFSVRTQLSGQRLEVKINNVRFISHPILLQSALSQFLPQRHQSFLELINIVIALKANADHSVVDCYYDLSKQLCLALRHEEHRCGYVTKQVLLMLAAHDEVASMAESCKESPYNLMLQESQLARDLKTIFQSLCTFGEVHLKINKWVQISFCLPKKVHYLHNQQLFIEPTDIYAILNNIRPYHSVLMLTDEVDLLDSLPADSSPALRRLMQVVSPVKSLQTLAADADLTLLQLFQLVGQLVYWAKAMVMYPLCDTNIYSLTPNAPVGSESDLSDAFSEAFPNHSLMQVLSEYSLPTSISQKRSPTSYLHEQVGDVQMVVWLLKHRLIMQLHTYIYFICPEKQRKTSSRQLEELVGSSMESSVGSDDAPLLPPPPHHDGMEKLTRREREHIMIIPAAANPDDIKMFLKLLCYFDGAHHIEEMMYLENMKRSTLMPILDKFTSVLHATDHEDPRLAKFYQNVEPHVKHHIFSK